MNQLAFPAWARTSASSTSSVGTTRITPSPPTPVRRSASATAREADRPSVPSRSGTSTKSFSVPCPLVKESRSAMGAIVPHGDSHLCHGVSKGDGVGGVDPPDPSVGPEPRDLAAGEPACRHDGLLLRLD